MTTHDFVVSGTCFTQVHRTWASRWEPSMNLEHFFKATSQAVQNAVDWGASQA